MLGAIFQDLEHLYVFQTISYGGHFVFQNGNLDIGISLCLYIEWQTKPQRIQNQGKMPPWKKSLVDIL